MDILFSILGKSDSIYTYNWDLVAEKSIKRLCIEQYKNYKYLLNNFKIINTNYSKGIFLKLHGSINWGVCKNRHCNEYGNIQIFKNAENPNSMIDMLAKCNICGKPLDILIIPPTSNKIEIQQNAIFHKEWLIAMNQLKKFQRIVFYGYSFPNTDFYSEWLFRQINYIIDGDRRVKYTIDVINPKMENVESYEYKRYHDIFRNHKVNSYSNVEEYIQREYKKCESNPLTYAST